MRLIYADELKKNLKPDKESMEQTPLLTWEQIWKDECEHIDDVPTVDPVKHGRWEKNEEGDYHCSLCQAIVESDEKHRHYWGYCYHCGAKMEVRAIYDDRD